MEVWHNLIINTISSHKSNNKQPCSVLEQIMFLRTNRDRFSATVFLLTASLSRYFLGDPEVRGTGTKRNEASNFEEEKKGASKKSWELRQETVLGRTSYASGRPWRQYYAMNLIWEGCSGKEKAGTWAKSRGMLESRQGGPNRLRQRRSSWTIWLPCTLSMSFYEVCACCCQKRRSGIFWKKSICYKLYLEYLKTLNTVTSCSYRLEFLKQCICALKKFSEQALKIFFWTSREQFSNKTSEIRNKLWRKEP